MSFSKRARQAREPRPDRRYRRLLPTVLTSAAIAAGALPVGAQAAPTPELALTATASGYALVTPAGKVAYSADGARARERCVRRALQLGAVRLR